VALGKQVARVQPTGLQGREVQPGAKSRIHAPKTSIIKRGIVPLFCECNWNP
jgi:hypothetical protein